jgi:hypothetical protein
MISGPLQDKLGTERVISHCAGWNWNPKDDEPKEDIMMAGEKRSSSPGTIEECDGIAPSSFERWRVYSRLRESWSSLQSGRGPC